MKKALVILAQDEVFKKWEDHKKECESKFEEEQEFFKKRLQDAHEKYLKKVWENAYDLLLERKMISKEEHAQLYNDEEDRRVGLKIEDGVLFTYNPEDETKLPSFIKNLLPN